MRCIGRAKGAERCDAVQLCLLGGVGFDDGGVGVPSCGVAMIAPDLDFRASAMLCFEQGEWRVAWLGKALPCLRRNGAGQVLR